MTIAIIGSRRLERWREAADEILQLLLSKPKDTVVVSGGALGVDTLAANAARALSLTLHEIRPEWGKYGRSAGIIRNVAIVERADEVYAWWDGKSKGTKHSIELAKKLGKPLQIHLTS